MRPWWDNKQIVSTLALGHFMACVEEVNRWWWWWESIWHGQFKRIRLADTWRGEWYDAMKSSVWALECECGCSEEEEDHHYICCYCFTFHMKKY